MRKGWHQTGQSCLRRRRRSVKNNGADNTIQRKRRKLVLTVLLGSLALHAAFACIAGLWIVVKRFNAPKETAPVLTATPPTPPAPAKVREQAMQAAAFEGAAARNSFSDRIQSAQISTLNLPKLPPLPKTAAPIFSDNASTNALLSNAAALSSGAGAAMGTGGGGAGGTGSGVSFLGVQTNAKRIVLMFDISRTVTNAASRAGMPMARIREETARLVESMGVNTRFGLVEFARNYAFFRPDLLTSTEANRKAAIAWLNTFFATEGTLPKALPNIVGGSPGFLVALEAVFKLQPDSVFILSDGSMQRGTGTASTIPISEIEQTLIRLQSSQPTRAKIFFVGVGVQPETEKSLKRLIATAGGGGGYTELKRDNRN